jgi:hypothetical protein
VNVAKATPAAGRVPSGFLLRLRGPVAFLGAVALLLGAPGLAYATFTARTTASVDVGTYEIPAPASITGGLECTTNRLGQTGATMGYTGFAQVERATAYSGTLKAPNGAQSTMQVSADSAVQVSIYGGAGKYTFSLTAKIGSWTGEPLVLSITC